LQEEATTSFWREMIESVGLAVILATLIRVFVFEPFYIPSPSMQPTLYANDRIIVNKLVYRLHVPSRQDVLVFKFPLDTSRDFIKRLIAFGGETVTIKNSHVYINGKELNEPYLQQLKMDNYGPYTVPQGYYFVMGDNRNDSEDSRFWGPLAAKYLIGKAEVIYWPPGRVRTLK
jgi:signal peptidase I